MSDATKAVAFLESLTVTEGRRAGRPVKLAPFQRMFVRKAMAQRTQMAVLSVARGGGKSTLSAGLALGALVGAWSDEPRRQVIIAARSKDQARICWDHAAAFVSCLPEELQGRLKLRRSPRLEIELDSEHMLTAIAADSRNALGASPSMIVMDERAHWPEGRGDDLEQALITSLHKRGGRCIMISTSAASDQHPFSRWLDDPPEGCYVQEHRPAPSLPADDRDSITEANPGARYGVGAPVKSLEHSARRAIEQGGHALTSFRLYCRNERVSAETRDMLLHIDEWLAAEVDTLPARSGPVVIGIDIGGSASMSAAAYYWCDTGRLEVHATLPGEPTLLARGRADAVGNRYCEMEDRGELSTLGVKTVPVAHWLATVLQRVDGETISAVVADRYKAAELSEAMDRAGMKSPVTWRGMGFRDGGEDAERFRRAVFDGDVVCSPSLLMRSALADAVCVRDPSNNIKIAKARSLGRIDAVSASVLAVAEGARQRARPTRPARAPQWA